MLVFFLVKLQVFSVVEGGSTLDKILKMWTKRLKYSEKEKYG